MKKSILLKGISLVLVVVMALNVVIPANPVEAASSNIKICDFIKLLVTAMEVEVDTAQTDAYLKAAMAAGIVKDEDFEDYNEYTSRTDAAVLLNRADEYLHGDTVDAKLLQTVLEKRISDINKIPKEKREAVAKTYAKGFIVGKSNGMYIQSRSFKGNDYLAAADAKKIVALLKNTKGRAKMSPDGQLIRTTNLPKNAKDYPYILEAFPNSFYEMKFMYQRATYSYKPVEGEDYARPTKVNETMSVLETDKKGRCVYIDDWMKKVEDNLKYRLNVNYCTIDNTWLNNLRSTYFIYKTEGSNKKTTDDIKEYMSYAKKNQVVIKCPIISVEPSTLYFDDAYRVRVYVKFKISFSGERKPLDKLFFVRQFVSLKEITKDKWFEGVYDIELATANGNSNGSDYAVFDDSLNDYFYKGK
ncbi:hypothetical protein [Anaerocolumna xylanovorans]|uniref:SLH domain-containing protein n=1 Tax=Anaerocolumna xylanovorans DSM 12503 TaxID=1121345 RepID=A0A1M7Y3D9_9FIRM|nr:hypothetical protein [Anaerocolumna xylanovorans]SHO46697.1 hypothetical protein SAMN02745217_01259 [Anaerocolumna xylanovorans DSM 12503]